MDPDLGNVWCYRDRVTEAFCSDMPFDTRVNAEPGEVTSSFTTEKPKPDGTWNLEPERIRCRIYGIWH